MGISWSLVTKQRLFLMACEIINRSKGSLWMKGNSLMPSISVDKMGSMFIFRSMQICSIWWIDDLIFNFPKVCFIAISQEIIHRYSPKQSGVSSKSGAMKKPSSKPPSFRWKGEEFSSDFLEIKAFTFSRIWVALARPTCLILN